MNLLHLISVLGRRGITVDCAYRTDFSETLIVVANREIKNYLTPDQSKKVRFCVARNENLVDDVTKVTGIGKSVLLDRSISYSVLIPYVTAIG